MKRLFVLMVILSAVMVGGGIMSLCLLSPINRLDRAKLADLESRFDPRKGSGNYNELYRRACSLQSDISSQHVESLASGGASGILIGLCIFGWGLDRRRLIRRIQASDERDRTEQATT